jgi:hypothetical protein
MYNMMLDAHLFLDAIHLQRTPNEFREVLAGVLTHELLEVNENFLWTKHEFTAMCDGRAKLTKLEVAVDVSNYNR